MIKKTFPLILVACAFLFDSGSVSGQTIFQANFDSEPLGPLVTQSNFYMIRDGDARVDVIAPGYGFSTPSLLIDGTPYNLASFAFYNRPQQLFSGKAIVEWSSAISALPPADASRKIGIAFVAETTTDMPGILWLTYEPSGNFRIGSPAEPTVDFGRYTPASPNHFRLLLDLDSHTYDLSVDNVPAASGYLPQSLGFSHTVFDNINRFSGSDFPALVVDDISVTLDTRATAFFPQVAIGDGYSTVFTVTNTGSTTASGSLILKDPKGDPLSANGTLTDSTGSTQPSHSGDTFSFTIPAGGTIFLSAEADQRKTGWVQLENTGGTLSGTANYEYRIGSPDQSMVSVPQSQPLQSATIPVSNDAEQGTQTAFAVANPSSQTIDIKLILVGQNGLVVDDTVTRTLGPGEQVAIYLWQEIDRANISNFKGSLVFQGQDGARFLVVALLDKRGLFTAIPIISAQTPI